MKQKISTAIVLIAVLITAGLVGLYITQSRKEKGPIFVSKEIDRYMRLQQPPMLTYDELVTLGTSKPIGVELGDKLHVITTTAFSE